MDIPFPYKSKEDISVKISTELCERLVKDIDFTKLVSEKLTELYWRYKDILTASTEELKSLLSQFELQALIVIFADSGELLKRTKKGKDLSTYLQYNGRFDKVCENLGVDCGDVLSKCECLTAAQVDALSVMVEENKDRASEFVDM